MNRIFLLGLTGLLLQAASAIGQDKSTDVLPEAANPGAAKGSEGPATKAPALTADDWRCGPTGWPRIWASSELLMWWTKSMPVTTPLVTQALSATDPTAGALGSANTAVMVGGQSYELNTRYGGRFTLGGWLDSEGWVGFEGTYLFIAPQSTDQVVGSAGAPGSNALGIPSFNPVTGMETVNTFTGAGLPGSAYIRLSNELQGGELNLLTGLVRTDNLRLSGIAGFRYLNFNEDLDFGLQNYAVPAADHYFSAVDNFHATNNFYGGQLGLRGEYHAGDFFVEVCGKAALGTMQQAVTVGGVSTAINPPPPASPPGFTFVNAPGGTFAQPTNFGNHTHNAFCVIPEAELKVGYNITRNIQGFVGYNYLYLSNVVQPGTVIDHMSNPSQVPALTAAPFPLVGPPAPGFGFVRSDFWAQGVNFGVQLKF